LRLIAAQPRMAFLFANSFTTNDSQLMLEELPQARGADVQRGIGQLPRGYFRLICGPIMVNRFALRNCGPPLLAPYRLRSCPVERLTRPPFVKS